MQSMWFHWSLGRRLLTACQKPKEEIPLFVISKEKRSSVQESNLIGKSVEVHRIARLEVYNDGLKNQTSHLKVLLGYAVLDCGAAKSLCGETCCSDGTDMCTRR